MTSSDMGKRNNGNGNNGTFKQQISSIDTIIHLVAGGAGGTTGAILTCPLEVVKTRLQSSNSGFGQATPGSSKHAHNLSNGNGAMSPASKMSAEGGSGRRPMSISAKKTTTPLSRSSRKIKCDSWDSRSRVVLPLNSHYQQGAYNFRFSSSMTQNLPSNSGNNKPLNVWQCLKYIVETEGFPGLFKGLGPNLVGVAPSRAIYFFTYSTAKKKVNSALPAKNRDTPFVHVVSAASAGFCASTCTNPIWLVKTRLQLDRASGNKALTVRNCLARINKERGIFGFWRGVTASYWGISETVIHFVIYESLKKSLCEYQNRTKRQADEKTFIDFFGFMLCGACSKTCATVVAYPHEVARTRLREEGTKYRSFWQTLAVVAKEEGRAGLYRGLVTQLIRQIPNTAIMMATYELTVYLMTKYFVEDPAERGCHQ